MWFLDVIKCCTVHARWVECCVSKEGSGSRHLQQRTTRVLDNFHLQIRAQNCRFLLLFCSLRTVPQHVKKEICGFKFTGYGAHHDNYPHSYLVCAAAIGVTKKEIDSFLLRLGKTMIKFRQNQQKPMKSPTLKLLDEHKQQKPAVSVEVARLRSQQLLPTSDERFPVRINQLRSVDSRRDKLLNFCAAFAIGAVFGIMLVPLAQRRLRRT